MEKKTYTNFSDRQQQAELQGGGITPYVTRIQPLSAHSFYPLYYVPISALRLLVPSTYMWLSSMDKNQGGTAQCLPTPPGSCLFPPLCSGVFWLPVLHTCGKVSFSILPLQRKEKKRKNCRGISGGHFSFSTS